MAEHPSSKSQERALRLLDLTSDGTYPGTEDVLVKAGIAGDGIPSGHTWRSAAKLSDDEIRPLLRTAPIEDVEHDAEGPRVARIPHQAMTRREVQAIGQRTRERQQQIHEDRNALKRAGYRWVRTDDYGTDVLGQEDFRLLDRDGNEISEAEALQRIGRGR